MTAHQWFVEHRTDFVARTLEPDEERSFTEHLAGCADCRAAIARLEQELAWLPMGLAPVPPRPGLTRALVGGALGERRGPPRWLVPLALAASLALSLGAWFWALGTTRAFERQLSAERERLVQELAMTRDTLGIMQEAGLVRHASISMGDKQGGLLIFADERTHRWNVVVYGLPASAPDEVCQFWFITESGMVRGVEVKTDGRSPALLTLPMPPNARNVMGAALTIEPMGASGAAPAGVELVHLMM